MGRMRGSWAAGVGPIPVDGMLTSLLVCYFFINCFGFDRCRFVVVGITNTIDNIVELFLLGLCMNDWIITCFAGLEFCLAFSEF